MDAIADFISNSAILPAVRPQRRSYGGTQIQPIAQKMAECRPNSAISSGPGWRESVAPPRDWVTDASSLPIRFWFRRCGSLR